MIPSIVLICIIVLLVIVGSILGIVSFARSKDYEISKAKLESKISRLERMIEDIRASIKAMDFGKAMDSRGLSSLPKEADALRGFVADKTNAPTSSLRGGKADEAIHSPAQTSGATNGLPRHASAARNDSTESAPRATNAESAPHKTFAESSANALGFDAHAEFAQRKVFAKTQIPESKILESKTQNPRIPESKIQKPNKLESGKSESRLDSSSLNYDKARDADSSSRAKSARSFEQIFTQKGMVFIAGIFFIFAAFFLIRYSIENALLTPQVRIALSMIFGALLLCFGFFCDAFGRYVKSPALSQSGIFARIGKRFGISHAALESTQSATTQNAAAQTATIQSIDVTQTQTTQATTTQLTTRAKPSAFASFLPSIQALSTITQTCIGAGLVVIFFSFYGGFKLYGFFGAFGVFAGLSLSALLALVLSLRFGLVVGIFGLLGAFCTPILLASNTYNVLSLFAYLAMFYAVVAYLAYRGGYVVLLYLASAFVLFYALDFGIHRKIDAPSFLVVAFMIALVICAHLLVFASPALWLASQNAESKNADSQNVDSVESSNQSTIQTRQKAPRATHFISALSQPFYMIFGFGVFSALSFLVLGALLLQAKELGFQSLEYSFLALLCVILLALPFLRNFARFAIDERVLTLPMIFAMLSAACVFFVERASEVIVGAFMLLFALGIALHIIKNLRAKSHQAESDKADTANKSNTANTADKPKSRASQTHEVWYLWAAWLCGVAFGFLAVAMPLLRGFDVVDLTSPFGGYFNTTKSFAIVIFVSVYVICARYKIALRNDSLLLLCAIGALFVPASMYFGDILEAKRFIYARAAAWWLLGGAMLLALGRTRFAPRDIAGFCFVFMAMGAIVFVRNAPLLENMLDALASSTLLDSGDVVSLVVYFVVCVVNLAIFARFLSGVKIGAKVKNSAESKAKRGIFGNSGNLDTFSDLAGQQTFSAGAYQTLRVFFIAHLFFGMLFFAWLMLYFCIWFFTALGLHGNSDVLVLSLHGALLALCALGIWRVKSKIHALLALLTAFSAFLMIYAAFDMMRVLLIFVGYILIDTPSRGAAMLVYAAPLMMIVVCVASFLLKLDIARGVESIRLAFAKDKPDTPESKRTESKRLDFAKIDSNIAESAFAKTATPESASAESTAPKSSTLESLLSFIQPAKLLRIFRTSEIALDAMIFVLSVFVVVFAMRLLFVGAADLTPPDGHTIFWRYTFFGAGIGEIEGYAYSLILALLGVACLVAFLRFGVRSFRIYSLILLLLAALKVFFIDTSSFGGLAKIALFIIMGALFLAISLVYSKYVFKKG